MRDLKALFDYMGYYKKTESFSRQKLLELNIDLTQIEEITRSFIENNINSQGINYEFLKISKIVPEPNTLHPEALRADVLVTTVLKNSKKSMTSNITASPGGMKTPLSNPSTVLLVDKNENGNISQSYQFPTTEDNFSSKLESNELIETKNEQQQLMLEFYFTKLPDENKWIAWNSKLYS